MNFDPQIAFESTRPAEPALMVRVNFGILAGREATPAEIEDLARELLALVEDVSIVAEQHYEIGHGHEAVVHQVRIEVGQDAVDGNLDELRGRLIETASRWARTCAEARHAEL